MSVTFWVLMIVLLFVFIMSMLFSLQGSKEDRTMSLLVSVVSFIMILVLNNMRW